jgi:hypothetical protein
MNHRQFQLSEGHARTKTFIYYCCVENIKAVEGSPSVEGVGEDAEGGFVMEGEVGTGAQRAAGGAFEAAEKALDLPALAITGAL